MEMGNYKTKSVKLFFYTLFTGLLLACNSQTDVQIEVDVRSPYGCVHQILIDKDGKGTIIAGTEDNYYVDNVKFKQILKKENFDLSDHDFSNIKKIINSIRNPIVKEPVNDGFRYMLFVDKDLKISTYGSSPFLLDTISNLLTKYYRFEVDYFCESYIRR